MNKILINRYHNHFKVKFSYNPDIVSIMRSVKGYYIPKTKEWSFPSYKLDAVISTLKSNGFTNITIKQATSRFDKKENEEVIATLGYCKKCNQLNFINKFGLCPKCFIESYQPTQD